MQPGARFLNQGKSHAVPPALATTRAPVESGQILEFGDRPDFDRRLVDDGGDGIGRGTCCQPPGHRDAGG
jgi:hypothetical protein